MSAFDNQEGGDHYLNLDPQPASVLRSWQVRHLEGDPHAGVNLGNGLHIKKPRHFCRGDSGFLVRRSGVSLLHVAKHRA